MDIGMSELLVIGIVALIVIGPKDLPELFRSLGRFTAKMRAMAREFSRAMEAAADEAGVKDVANDLKAVANPKAMGIDAVKEAAAKFEKWDPLKPVTRPTPAATPAAVATPAAASPATAAASTLTSAADAAAAAQQAATQPLAAPATPVLGPNTQALADKVAERRAIALEAAEKLRKTAAPPAPVPAKAEAAPAAKPRGRVRSKAEAPAADQAATPKAAKPKAPAKTKSPAPDA